MTLAAAESIDQGMQNRHRVTGMRKMERTLAKTVLHASKVLKCWCSMLSLQ